MDRELSVTITRHVFGWWLLQHLTIHTGTVHIWIISSLWPNEKIEKILKGVQLLFQNWSHTTISTLPKP